MTRLASSALAMLLLSGGVLGTRAQAQIAENPSAEEPSAEEPSAAALARYASELASEDATARADAFHALSHLPAAWIEATQARAAHLARRPLQEESTQEAIRSFRHATGSRRADEMIDIAPGVLPALAQRHDRETVAMAERIALMRSMEALPGRAAGRALMDVLALDPAVERWERRRILHRQGLGLLPSLIDARSHPSPAIRRWARQAIPVVGGADAGRVVRALSSRDALLADSLMAWADARDFDAMPVVVTFMDADDLRVREAARDAMRAYGQNGIWMLRRQYRSSLGQDAPTEWGWRRTYDELVTGLETRRLAPARDALAAGLAAAETDDLEEMRRHFDQAARLAPRLQGREQMVPGYARWAESEMAAERFDIARGAFLRASRLTDDEGAAEDLRARALLAEAEAEWAAGIVDLDAYRIVNQLSPGQALAVERMRDRAVNHNAAIGTRELAMLAGAALAVLGLLLLFGRELPAVQLARRAALAGARMATSAGRTLRARAHRTLRRDEAAQWTRSMPLALLHAKPAPGTPPDTAGEAASECMLQELCLEANDALTTAPGDLDALEPSSTAPGLDVAGECFSTAPGLDAPSAVISTAPDHGLDAVHQAEALGILHVEPEPLDPFEDDDPFEGADLF